METMTAGTTAVMTEQLGYAQDATEQPLCPACRDGRLHPYAVTFGFPMVTDGLHFTGERVDYLDGWVAVCVGNEAYERDMAKRLAEPYEPNEPSPPCGFSMPLTPHRRAGYVEGWRP
jgi:hypothetical protein